MGGRDDLWNEALALLLAWRRAPEDEASRDAIRAFCAESPEHRAAWDEAKNVFLLTGAASAAVRPKRPGATRRQVVAGMVGLIGLGAAAVGGPALLQRFSADETTDVAQIRRTRLADGSWLTLGPESAAKFAFRPSERRVGLLGGMAFCEVAVGERAFHCEGALVTVSTTDGVFELRTIEGRETVGVAAGRATVRWLDRNEGETLSAGDWLAIGPEHGEVRRGRRDPLAMAAWRRNQQIAEDEAIASVVAEIAGWKLGRVLIPEPSLAAARVSGLYDLSDPDSALAAVVAPYGGRVRAFSPWLTILTTV
ncbi:MAG: FecR domain-containing protein [Hansschlegelia sp.]